MASRRERNHQGSSFNPYRVSDRCSTRMQRSQDEYGSVADSSMFDRPQLNSCGSTGRGNSQDLYNHALDSSLSRPSYNSRGRDASQNVYNSAHEYSSSRPSYSSSGRDASQNVYNSAHESSLSRPSYNSTGRDASQNVYNSAHESSSSRPSYSSSGRDASQNLYNSAHESSLSTPSYNSTGRDASQNVYNPAHESSLSRPSYSFRDGDESQNAYTPTFDSLFDGPSYTSRGRDASRNTYNHNPAHVSLVSRPSHSFSDRNASQDACNRALDSSSGRPAFNSYGRGCKSQPFNPYSSETNKSRDHQSYNSNQNVGLPQTSRIVKEEFTEDRIKDAEMFHSSKEYLETPKRFERPDNSSGNHEESEVSNEDIDGFTVEDLNCDENLLKYIDKLLFLKQNGLQEAVEKYNALVRKFDASGRKFTKPDKKMYLHWRRSIKCASGFLKCDLTSLPPDQFILDQILIDETQLLGQVDPEPSGIQQAPYDSGLPNPKPDFKTTRNARKKMRHRMVMKGRFDLENNAMEKLRGNVELKKEIFGDFAKSYLKSKVIGKNAEAKRILKIMREKVRQLGAEN